MSVSQTPPLQCSASAPARSKIPRQTAGSLIHGAHLNKSHVDQQGSLVKKWPQRSPDSKRHSLSDYTIGRQIGRGAYATVKIAVHKPSGLKVALKSYSKSKLRTATQLQNVRKEVQVLKRVNHPHIVRLIDTIENPQQIVLAMDLVTGDSLLQVVKKAKQLPEREAHRIFRGVASAVLYCHANQIAHRDIKTDNVLIDEELQPKLIDFGFSTCSDLDRKQKMYCGTPSYMAPQIVARREFAAGPADVWALGVVLFVMLSGKHPFVGTCDAELFRRIQRGFLIFPQHVSGGCKSLLSKMLTVSAEARISIQGVVEDEWFVKGNQELRSYKD